MGKDSLTSKINKIFNFNHPNKLKKFPKHGNFNYSSRKKIESKDVEEGIKFSLKFNSFRLLDFTKGDFYQFPGGHVAVIYRQGSDSLSTPFVEEIYSHPILMNFNHENQPLDLGYFDEKIEILPIEKRIVKMLEKSVNFLQEYGQGLSPCYPLNRHYFEKYIINPTEL